MKTTNWMVIFLLAGVFALDGCGKKAPPPTATVVGGVAIDLPKLREAFATSSPELQNTVLQVSSSVRYGVYPQALASLAALAANPSLTATQKDLVAQVTEQVKQAASKVPAPPAREPH